MNKVNAKSTIINVYINKNILISVCAGFNDIVSRIWIKISPPNGEKLYVQDKN